MTSFIHVAGWWTTRPEEPDAISDRLARWLSGLREIDPRLGCWSRAGMRHFSVVPKIVTMPPDQAELRDWIGENPIFAARDGRKATIGYWITAETPEADGIGGIFSLRSGNEKNSRWRPNEISITWILPRHDPKTQIGMVRGVLLANATEWNCEWAGAMPGDFAPEARRGRLSEFQSGWMIYLDRPHVARLSLPEGIATEHLSDGAIVMTTAPNEIFNHDNAAHYFAAERVQAALNRLSDADLPS